MLLKLSKCTQRPEGIYVVDINKSIDITMITPLTRVALKNDNYVLHLVLPSKIDPLVNLMKVEKILDSTYDMIDGLDQQIKGLRRLLNFQSNIHSYLSLGIAQSKVMSCAMFLNLYCSCVSINRADFLEYAPSIIFTDEIDGIGSARMEYGSGNCDSEVQRIMLELLNKLDGFEASNKIKVVCTEAGMFALRERRVHVRPWPNSCKRKPRITSKTDYVRGRGVFG